LADSILPAVPRCHGLQPGIIHTLRLACGHALTEQNQIDPVPFPFEIELQCVLIGNQRHRRQLFLGTVWEARHGILAAGLTAFGRVLTEVGIAMMVGGNIKWQTRTVTTAIALETNKGEFAAGIALGLVLLIIAFSVTLSVSFLRKRY